METKIAYPHILKPLTVGNTILRNRMVASPSKPNCAQGPEDYPGPAYIAHYANKAKNGASLVTCTVINPDPVSNPHTASFDYKNPLVMNYICQLTDAIHAYGSKASVFVLPEWDKTCDVSIGASDEKHGGKPAEKEFTPEQLEDICRSYAEECARFQELGFDAAYLHMAYRGLPPSRFLSPLCNKRTDEFGGSLENRMRFPLMVCDAIKEKCGRDFLLEVSVSGTDPEGSGGTTIRDTVEFIRAGQGHFDLVQIRAPKIEPAHPTGYQDEHIPFLDLAAQVKAAGVPVPVGTIAGCFYPEDNEKLLAEGKADYVAMARSWISNPAYGECIFEGRPEDIVPCIRCNKCHRAAPNAPWISVCSVNPVYGIEDRAEKLVSPVKRLKKVAVVGGGPAGMEAALVAAKRGHTVTLFEKTDRLGGQLIPASVPRFKWPLRNYKDYLLRQMEKNAIDVRLNTEAKAELLKDYDEIICCIGSEPIVPGIPGAKGKNVMTAIDAYGREPELGEKIVVIGGGEIGTETGLHLAERGHRVTVLEMRDRIAADAAPSMYRWAVVDLAEKLPNFEAVTEATVTEITETGVVYTKGGKTHTVPADSVVLAVGSRGLSTRAHELYNDGQRVILAGDCIKAGDVQKAVRTAYVAASNI